METSEEPVKETSSAAVEMKVSDDKDSHTEHLKLAAVVKGIHAKLRKKYRETGDIDKTWNEHCQDEQILSNYADAMHHLAVDHWTQRPETRIHWCRDMCFKYFKDDGLKRALEKDFRRKRHESLCTSGSSQADEASLVDEISENEGISITNNVTNAMYGTSINAQNELVLLKSPPMRFPMLRIRKRNNSPQLDIKLPQKDGEPDNLSKTSPCGCFGVSPQFASPVDGGMWPPKGEQKDPMEKCSDYMESIEMTDQDEPSSQGSGSGKSVDSFEDSEGEKQDICGKYELFKYNIITLPFDGKIRLLDVGSCYNPFIQYNEFLAVGIDISPAVDSVFRCDFLHLDTPEPLQLARDTIDTMLSNLPDPVTKLPRESFHVVVFSLLLEYFPSPYQRWLCCQKAHSLLMMNGLLLIVTPDSQHQNKNAPMMKSWKKAIQSMGFKRYAYEKQEHLHCIAFRKVASEGEGNGGTLLNDVSPDLLYIPQDISEPFVPGFMGMHENSFDCLMRSEQEDLFMRDGFQELPGFIE